MSYTQAEKLQILMMCDIFEALNIDNSFDPEIVRDAINSGNYWSLSWEYPVLDTGQGNPDDVKFVCEVLDMYHFLKFTFDNLTDDQKSRLADEIPHFGGEDEVIFPGFDGNNEYEYLSICDTLSKLGRFNTMNLNVNSHFPQVHVYARMVQAFNPARENIMPGRGLSYTELKNILLARIHPDNR